MVSCSARSSKLQEPSDKLKFINSFQQYLDCIKKIGFQVSVKALCLFVPNHTNSTARSQAVKVNFYDIMQRLGHILHSSGRIQRLCKSDGNVANGSR